MREVIEQAKTQLPATTQLHDSTVRRLLCREGLMQQTAGTAPDSRRFAYRHAHELWMSDVMHGPKIKVGQHRHRSYLIAIIDDATRVIPYSSLLARKMRRSFWWCSKRHCCGAACRSGCTSTTAPTIVRSI